MTTRFTYDVFLSYNSKDRLRVRRLAERLKEADLRVWLDELVIKAGDDIYLAIEKGLEVSRALVLCMSPAAFGSDWVSLERGTVIFRDPTNKGRRFVPLLLADCEIPDALRRYKYIDYREENDASLEELIASCSSELEVAQLEPQVQDNGRSGSRADSRLHGPALAIPGLKLVGHTGSVRSVAVSPDGNWVISGSNDRTIKVWKIETGECHATLEGHEGGITCVTTTPDGGEILSASSDATIRRWDAKENRFLGIFVNRVGVALSVCAVPLGRVLSAWSMRGRDSELRELNSKRCVWEIEAALGKVTYTFTSLDGRIAASGSQDAVRIWDLEAGQCLATLRGHSERVYSVQITSDQRYVISGSEDKTIKIWDIDKSSCVGTLEGHKKAVHSVAISPDDTLIASAGFTDETVRLWDLKSGVCLQIIEFEGRISPLCVAFSPDGKKILIGTAAGHVHIYQVTGSKPEVSVDAARRYVNAKVVLLGESGVGKSALAHRLVEDRFVPTYSTHGMQVWRLDLPIKQTENLEREALLWDLAGQEDYRLIHQLFLDETALALVLMNPQKDDPFAELGDWLRALTAAVTTKDPRRETTKLLVAARVDVGGVKVSQRKVDRFIRDYEFSGFIQTSARRGDNCSDLENSGRPSILKEMISQYIPWDTLPWTSTPRLLGAIKNALLEMREKKDIRLLRFAELYQRLEQTLSGQSFTEADVRTAVTLLANHGLLMPFKFGDLVLLRPELINGYAGAVIRAARTNIEEIGYVHEESIYDERFDFEGVERLDAADEDLLLRAMVQTFLDRSLCILEPTESGRLLIFPSQYRREMLIPNYPEVFLSYTFSGELQTIYATLVVRLWYSKTFDKKELWQNAAEFKTTRGKTVGLVMTRLGEGEGKISVFFEPRVPDEIKVMFIEYIHRHLAKYAFKVHRDRRYVCSECGRLVIDVEVVRSRIAAGKDFVYCQGCDQKILLVDHIEQRLATDPVARWVLSMDEKATQGLDAQVLEQILIGHMMAICGESNQLFRVKSMFEYGIDGELEFRDNDGRPSGQKVLVQLQSSGSYHRVLNTDGCEVFHVKDERHLEYWLTQSTDVFLVARDDQEVIRWMNITRYLKGREDRHIIFDGEKLDAPAVWRVRDEYFGRGGKALS